MPKNLAQIRYTGDAAGLPFARHQADIRAGPKATEPGVKAVQVRKRLRPWRVIEPALDIGLNQISCVRSFDRFDGDGCHAGF